MSKRSEPCKWEDYDDGSGWLETVFGHRLYGYDLVTSEMDNPFSGNGTRFDPESDWRNKCENAYKENIYPKEVRSLEMGELGIYLPFLPKSQGHGTCDRLYPEEYEFSVINNDVMISTKKLNEIHSTLSEARCYGDAYYSIDDTARQLNSVYKESGDSDTLTLKYKDLTVDVSKSDIIPLPDEAARLMKENAPVSDWKKYAEKFGFKTDDFEFDAPDEEDPMLFIRSPYVDYDGPSSLEF